jgi:hypothetical protein
MSLRVIAAAVPGISYTSEILNEIGHGFHAVVAWGSLHLDLLSVPCCGPEKLEASELPNKTFHTEQPNGETPDQRGIRQPTDSWICYMLKLLE